MTSWVSFATKAKAYGFCLVGSCTISAPYHLCLKGKPQLGTSTQNIKPVQALSMKVDLGQKIVVVGSTYPFILDRIRDYRAFLTPPAF